MKRMLSEDIEAKTFLREYLKELHNKNAGVFIGAGMSIPAGYLDWKGLLHEVVVDLKLDPEKEYDLVSVAQYSVNKAGGNKGGLTKRIVDEFMRVKKPQRNHELLAHLPIQVYWTTNYDKLIETALQNAKKVPDVKYTEQQLRVTRPDRDVTVYKMHGDVEHAEKAIISKDDYERYPRTMDSFVRALGGDFIERTFLFLGFSFTDPNIDYILSRVRANHDGSPRPHYCVMKRVGKKEYGTKKESEYYELRQQYFIKDLARFGIQTVLVDEYKEVTELLEDLATKYKRNSIFISGAAHEYGKWAAKDALDFAHDLSYALASNKNRIITGFGVGIGSAVINGTLKYLDEQGKTISDEDLVMRPFPQVATKGQDLKKLWHSYRESMMSHAGIGVFLFGNKEVAGKTVLSDGLEKEFELCIAAGGKPIVVGATGYMAEQLWQRVIGNWDQYFQGMSATFKKDYMALGKAPKNLGDLTPTITRLVKELQKN